MGTSYNPRIVTDGLVLCLDAANKRSYPGAGTVWTDLKGGNNGSLTNEPTFDAGNGGSIATDGTNDYIGIGNSIVPNGDFTFSFWIYNGSSGAGSYPRLFGTNNDYFEISIHNDGSIHFYKDSGGGWQSVGSSDTLTWNNILYVRSTNVDMFYLNSIKIFSSAQDSHPYNASTNSHRLCARYNDNEPFMGNISSFSTYNRALTADEIRQNYLATKERYV